jgi:hypothetical protein
LQGCPFGFLFTHTPPEQYWVDAHCVSLVQPPHCVPLHAVQLCVCAGGQDAALPGQFAGSVATGGGPGSQLAARHCTVDG